MTDMALRVVFDCYGTLIEDRPESQHEQLVASMARACVVDERLGARMLGWLHTRIFRSIHAVDAPSPAMDDLLRECVARFGVGPLSPQAHDALLLELFGRGGDLAAVPGSVAAVALVRDSGAQLAILSNSELPSRLLLELLRRAGHDVDAFGVHHFSGDGGPRKPHSAAFARVEGQGCRHVMVGDSETHDLQPARARGWRTVKVGADMTADLESVIADALSPGKEVTRHA